MIELVGLIGFISSISTLTNANAGTLLQKFWKTWDEKKQKELIKQIADNRKERLEITKRGLINEALVQFYSRNPDNSEFELYRSIIPNKNKRIAYAIKPQWLNLDLNMAEAKIEYTFLGNDDNTLDLDAEKAIEKWQEMKLSGVQIWNADLYTLSSIAISQNHMNVEFCLSSYFEHIFGFGSVQEELNQALIQNEKNVNKLMVAPNQLPIRAKKAPTLGKITELNNRIVPVGMNALVALRREERENDDYAFILQKRSSNVAEVPGAYAVIPSLNHQPTVDVEKESNLMSSLWREIFEEMLGGEELGKDVTTGHLVPNWYEKANEAMAKLTTTGYADVYITTCGFNLVSGHFDFSFLVDVKCPDFWADHWHELKGNWEISNSVAPIISSKEDELLLSLIQREDWSPSSQVAFELGIKKMFKLHPNMFYEKSFLK